MSNLPAFIVAPLAGDVTISTANTARDGTGTLGTVATAPAGGARIESVTLKAQGTTTAGMVRLFKHDGTTARLVAELPVLANTPAASTPTWETVLESGNSALFPMVLPNGWSLRASTHNAESFNVSANRAGSF